MKDQEIWNLLERLGGARRGHFDLGEWHTAVTVSSVDPLADPSAAQALAQALAATLPQPPPDRLLVWGDVPNLMIGLLVGVSLDRPIVRLADDEGVVFSSARLEAGERVALIGDLLTERQVRLAQAFVQNRGAQLTSVSAIVDDGQAGALNALASAASQRFAPPDCPLCKAGQPLENQAGNSAVGASGAWR